MILRKEGRWWGTKMRRLLLDTNIYGLLIADEQLFRLKEEYNKKRAEYPVYALSLIRKELRATSKDKTLLNHNLRIALLSLYDEFVGSHQLIINENELMPIAKQYFQMYQELGGGFGREELWNDFMIVAGAAKKDLDIVVSHDKATMLSELSLKTYEMVNKSLNLKNPEFYDYLDFRDLLLRPPV